MVIIRQVCVCIEAYKYSKLCQRCACLELRYNFFRDSTVLVEHGFLIAEFSQSLSDTSHSVRLPG
jgi:hypothetical protein